MTTCNEDDMHFYSHNIGQFAADTAGLSLAHTGAFVRLVDRYAHTEKPVKTCWVKLGFSGKDYETAMEVLEALFVETPDGFIYPPMKEIIESYQKLADVSRANGKKGGRPRKNNPEKTDQVFSGYENETQKNLGGLQPITNNQEPITNNQDREEVEEESAPAADCSHFDHLENEEPAISSTTESRSRKDADANEDTETRQAGELYHDGKAAKVRKSLTTTLEESDVGETVPDDWREYCEQVRPDIDARTLFADFRFYYTKGDGMGKRQKNWTATWQGWVRRQKTGSQVKQQPKRTEMRFTADSDLYTKTRPDSAWGIV